VGLYDKYNEIAVSTVNISEQALASGIMQVVDGISLLSNRGSKKIIFWNKDDGANADYVIPDYLEDNAIKIRDKYLSFIYELGIKSYCGKTIVEWLDVGDGGNLWWMSRLAVKCPFMSPNINDCLKLLALEDLLNSISIKKIILCTNDVRLHDSIKRLCKNLNIDFICENKDLENERFTSNGGNDNHKRVNFIASAMTSLFRSMLSRGLRWRRKKINWLQNHNSVFFLSYFIHLDPGRLKLGEFYSRQWGRLPELFSSFNIKMNWIHHFVTSKEVPDRDSGMKCHNAFNTNSCNQGHHEYLDAYFSLDLIPRVLVKYIKLLYKLPDDESISDFFSFSGSNVWFWPYLKQDWYDSVVGKTSIQNILWIELFNVSMSNIPLQKFGFYLMENQGWERAFINSWRRHGHGKLVGVAHSTVRFWDLRYFDDANTFLFQTEHKQPTPNFIALTGQDMVDKYREAKYPLNNLEEVEALRYIKNPHNEDKQNCNMNNSGSKKRVIILGSGDKNFTCSVLYIVNNLAGKLSNYEFSFKAHPAAPVEIIAFSKLRLKEVTDNIIDITSLFDIALIVGETGAALDVYIEGLSVIVYDNNQGVNLSPLRGIDDVSFTHTSADLYRTFSKLGSQNTIMKNESYFWRDAGLPRWRNLLSNMGHDQFISS